MQLVCWEQRICPLLSPQWLKIWTVLVFAFSGNELRITWLTILQTTNAPINTRSPWLSEAHLPGAWNTSRGPSLCREDVVRGWGRGWTASLMIPSTFLWFTATCRSIAVFEQSSSPIVAAFTRARVTAAIGAAKPWRIPPGLALPLVSHHGWKHRPEIP